MKFLLVLALVPLAVFAGKVQFSPKKSYHDVIEEVGGVANKAGKSEQFDQYIECWDYFGSQGSSFRSYDYVPRLSSNGWDNRISSCCMHGIFTLFEYDDYNQNAQSVSNH